MIRRTVFIPAVVRLIRDHEPPPRLRPRRYYRPLSVGLAVLHRAVGSCERWTVDLADDSSLRPRASRSAALVAREVERLHEAGRQCRVALALACPDDAAALPDARATAGATRRPLPLRSEFYGWSLLYQPPGMRGRAVVDADDRFADLPACFELPLELLDRAAHMEARGVRTRPIAVVARPEDFVADDDGRPRNRFFPEAVFRVSRSTDFLNG